MSGAFAFLLAAALLVAVQFRDSFAFTLLYFFGGVYFFSRVWSAYSLRKVVFRREYPPHVFPGESVQVHLHLQNTGWLGVPWLHLQDGLPVEIAAEGSFHRVVTLGARQHLTLTYDLQPRKRGLYPIGPLRLVGGDLFGLTPMQRREGGSDYLLVYPRLMPLPQAHLPSRAPLGTLPHHLPIFEDPTRPIGKRLYQSGDSLRQVDWKTSAAQGRLHVRQYEPAIALGLMLALNLETRDYPLRSRRDASELGIMAAASLAHWSIEHGQAAGLWLHGRDALSEHQALLPVHKGRAHLMQMLAALARVQTAEMPDTFVSALLKNSARLPWGTTLAIITPQAGQTLFDALFAIRRRGVQVMLLLCGDVPEVAATRQRAARFGIPFQHLADERHLVRDLSQSL